MNAGKNATWHVEPSTHQLGRSRFQLHQGTASFKLNNGVVVDVLGPAEIELLAVDSIELGKGNFIVEVPRSVEAFKIVTPFATLQEPVNARLQLAIDPQTGLETMVSRGQIVLDQTGEGETQDVTELARNGLFQSVVRPVLNRPVISPVTIARGQQQFMAQIGKGKNAIQLNSPLVFANVLERVNGPTETDPDAAAKLQNWPRFAKDFQLLQARGDTPGINLLLNEFFAPNPRDDSNAGTTNFQGSLSINGSERKFDSREEFEQASKQFLDGVGLLGNRSALPAAKANQATDFMGVIHVNGHKLEFRSPEDFRAIRNQMNR